MQDGGTTALKTAATKAYEAGRLDEAASLGAQWLAGRPSDPEALLLAGMVATRKGQLQDAVRLLTMATERDPSSYQAHYWLSLALRRRGNAPLAKTAAEKALAARQGDAQALHQVGLCCMDLQDWPAAVRFLQDAAKADPAIPETHFNLAVALETLKRTGEAEAAYRRALALNPDHAGALPRLGQLLIHRADYEGAADCGRRMLKLDPNFSFAHSLLAFSFVSRNMPEEAESHAARCVTLAPDSPDALALYGTILQALGRMDESEPHLRRSVELSPIQGYAYYALVRARKLTEEDRPLLGKMKMAAAHPGLPLRSRGEVQYAMGKAHGDLGEFEASMRHYDLANRFTREASFGSFEFDRAAYVRGAHAVMRACPEVSKADSGAARDETPVLVVGMMRSGTTLVEQILTSHPAIGGAGEQRFWMDRVQMALDRAAALDGTLLKELAGEYVGLLRGFAPGRRRVVDKMPGNSLYLGLIHQALPNARIIHVRRLPVDTCLSIWITPNLSPSAWANKKADIVFVYREYLRVMEHWRSSLKTDRLFEIDYEDLVGAPERTIPRLIEFCGLPWDGRCLHPEDNRRVVSTPSAHQVRQPIYRTAVERWRAYEPWLGEFRELL